MNGPTARLAAGGVAVPAMICTERVAAEPPLSATVVVSMYTPGIEYACEASPAVTVTGVLPSPKSAVTVSGSDHEDVRPDTVKVDVNGAMDVVGVIELVKPIGS